jgi:RNA polymerase sigma factor (TIGR02999 family)
MSSSEPPGSASEDPAGPAPDRAPAAAPDDTAEVSRLIRAWQGGDEAALGELVPLVYAELQRLAHRALLGEGAGHTLQTTALVHEAYVRLVGADVAWQGSTHFFRVAARAMRRVLVDHARKRKSRKRGGDAKPLALDSVEEILPDQSRPGDLIELDEALERLLALDERKGRAVELHYFGGLSYEEVAEALAVSPATVHRDLRVARAWLYKELRDGDAGTTATT